MPNLRANISGEEHDRDNRERVLETTGSPIHRLKISRNFGALTAKNIDRRLPFENSAFFVIAGFCTGSSADKTQSNFGGKPR